VSFGVEKGELAVVLGPSGAGKTTVLNILGGMDKCNSGSVIVDGKNIAKYSNHELTKYRRDDIGFVFQFYNLVQNLTSLENIELTNQICDDTLPAKEVLASVGLKDRMNNFPSQLSGGELQRAALARALAIDPEIILADEPTGNLDPENSWNLVKLLKDINQKNNTTIIMTTHNYEIVDALGKRKIEIVNGEIKKDPSKIIHKVIHSAKKNEHN
jgi:putative ABC transport system ATP-binding protein